MSDQTLDGEELNQSQDQEAKQPDNQVGRNEPCPCGSGKKYKRCHGVNAAPKITAPIAGSAGAGSGFQMNPEMESAMRDASAHAGMDPSKMSPEFMGNMMSVMQKIPRGQLMKLQSLMQRAMSGQDVASELQNFERTLPPSVKAQLASLTGGMGMPSMEAGADSSEAAGASATQDEGSLAGSSGDMISDVLARSASKSVIETKATRVDQVPNTESEARAVIEQAVREGKMTKDDAEKLLGQPVTSAASPTEEKKGGFWNKLIGKK